MALTTWWDVGRLEEEGLEILKVEYLDDLSSMKSDLVTLIAEQGDQTKTRNEREEKREARAKLEARHKHCDYASEKEVRLVYFLGDESGSVIGSNFRFEASGGRLRSYIERPVRLGTTLTGMDIAFGPRMTKSDVMHWTKVGEWALAQMGLSGGRVAKSHLKYLG